METNKNLKWIASGEYESLNKRLIEGQIFMAMGIIEKQKEEFFRKMIREHLHWYQYPVFLLSLYLQKWVSKRITFIQQEGNPLAYGVKINGETYWWKPPNNLSDLVSGISLQK